MRDLSARPVLIVEDLDFDYEMTVRGFRRMGVKAPVIRHETVSDTSRFLEEIAMETDPAKLPGVVILDLQLNDGEGREILTQIKSHDALKSIPVVVWSANPDPSVVNDCYRAGASSYIRKAADRQVAQSAVEQFVLYWMKTVTLSSPHDTN